MNKHILRKLRGSIFIGVSISNILLILSKAIDFGLFNYVMIFADILYLIISGMMIFANMEAIHYKGFSIYITSPRESDERQTHAYILNDKKEVIVGSSVIELKDGSYGYVAAISKNEEHAYVIDPKDGAASKIYLTDNQEPISEDLIHEIQNLDEKDIT